MSVLSRLFYEKIQAGDQNQSNLGVCIGMVSTHKAGFDYEKFKHRYRNFQPLHSSQIVPVSFDRMWIASLVKENNLPRRLWLIYESQADKVWPPPPTCHMLSLCITFFNDRNKDFLQAMAVKQLSMWFGQ